MSSPSTKMVPRSGFNKAMRSLSVTLLPVPLRPKMHMASPAGTEKETFGSTKVSSKSLEGLVEYDSRSFVPTVSERTLGEYKEDALDEDDIGYDYQERRDDDAVGGRSPHAPWLVVYPKYDETVTPHF